MRRLISRLLASALCAALILVSPGLEGYQAFGAQFSGRTAPIRVSVPGPSGLSAAPVAKLALPLAAPGLSLTAPSASVALSLAPALSVLPAAASPALLNAPDAQAFGKLSDVQAAFTEAVKPEASPESARQAGASFDGAMPVQDASVQIDGPAAPQPSLAPAGVVPARKGAFDRGVASLRKAITSPKNTLRSALIMGALGFMMVTGLTAKVLPAFVPPASVIRMVQQAAPAQGALMGPPAVQDAAPQAPAPVQGPVSASVSIERQGVTVGERLHISLTLKNNAPSAVTFSSLRSALQDAIPEDLEIQGAAGDEPITLAPGQSKTVSFEVIAFASGDLKLTGAVVAVPVLGADGQVSETTIILPESVLKVKTVLTPDWKEKGLRDIAGVLNRGLPSLAWLAAIPLALILLIGVERLIAARRSHPGVPSSRLPLLILTDERINALAAGKAERASFYAELSDILGTFLVDFHGLPVKQRGARALAAELGSIRSLASGPQAVARALLLRAEEARFDGKPEDPEQRRRDLIALRALVDAVSGRREPSGEKGEGRLRDLPGAAMLTFGSPWALALLVPYAGFLVWRWLNRSSASAYNLPSAASLPAKKSLRQRLSWLPGALRMTAIGLILLALARPQLGVTRQETFTPSTDSVISLDLSGSMDESFSGNGGPSKLKAAEDAIATYITEQRRGTENRVGMVTFSDKAYLDVRLTTDYDALIAHLKELKTSGSTAVGKSMLTAIGHFAEINILELSDLKDPRIQRIKTILEKEGIGAAIEFAKADPDLLDKVLRPDRKKIVVVFTDGQSNEGIPPLEAAEIAKKLGVRIYTVGIGGPNNASGLDEKTLRGVADLTGAQYYRADDAARMQQVLVEISRLEKSPSKIISAVSVKDYQSWLVLLAFLMLGLELGLVNTRLRSLPAVALMLTMSWSAPLLPPTGASLVQQVSLSQAVVPQATDILPLTKLPPELAAGNKLYAEGRYEAALKKYAEALAQHPDVFELYFNMGNAYLKLGDAERAAASYQKFLAGKPDAVLASKALFNLGNAALMKKDGEQAVELYKEALRRDAGNGDAKWNLEALKQQQKEQEKDGKPKDGKQKGKKGQKGQKGQPGDQKGDQKGDGQPGEPGDQKGQPQPGDGKDKEKGAEQLGDKLGEQEKGDAEAARKGITRKGNGNWGMLAMPMAMGGGTALTFGSSLVFWCLGIGLPLIGALIAYGLYKKLRAARALSPGTAPKSFASWWGRKAFLRKSALVVGAAGLLAMAAGDPRSGFKDENLNFGGKDIVVAVDGSHSTMYAEDGRAEKAKKELVEFITHLKGTDRVGLVIFAGSARTASPISIDYGNFEFKINRLEIEARGLKEGSDLGEAVKFSASSFETVKKVGDRQRVLIVISDGDIFDSEIEEAIAAAQQHGITIYTIVVGSPAGTKMKVPTEDGKGTEYIIDGKTGQPALTMLKEAPLQAIAQRTGGAYFRADKDASIQKVLERVAELQKGQKSDTIKSPNGVAGIFLLPAALLLLLDLLMKGASVLKKEPSAAPKKKAVAGGSRPGPGAGLLGAALLPLSAWPEILPFALLFTLGGALLTAEIWTRGSLSRRLRWAWGRRLKIVDKGLAADLGSLFDAREIDQARLTAFLADWRAAPEPARKQLTALAAADVQLWREKLIIAALAGGTLETREGVYVALAAGPRRHMEPLEPAIAALLSRRAQLPWMEHIDAAERLDRLARLTLPPAAAAPKERMSFLRRTALLASLVVLGVGATIGGAAGLKTFEFFQAREQAAQVSLQIFYGEDSFIFADRYADERINQFVLPALRRWDRGGRAAQAELELAIAVLQESPDPKADNLLEALFKRADLLPLSPKAETTLLTTLVQRENPQVWAFIEAQLVLTAESPRAVERMTRMMEISASAGTEKGFQNVFHFLKSPNPRLRGQAASLIYGQLTAPKSLPQFFQRLTAVQSVYAADPSINLWVEMFLLRHAGAAAAKDFDFTKAKPLLDRVFDAAATIDAARPKALAAVKPGEEEKVPPSFLETALSLVENAQEGAVQSSGAVPPTLAELSKYAVNRNATKLIQEAEKQFPGLHAKLIAAGVVNPDVEAQYDERDYEGYGGSSGGPSYRQLYKLAQLRAAAEIIAADAAAAKDLKIEQRELALRAAAAFARFEGAGKAAGMLDGGSPAEKAADEVNALLKEGASAFSGNGLLGALRAAGLAPDNGAVDESAYKEAYAADDLVKLSALLRGVAASGQGWDYQGKPRPLSWSEKKYLAAALSRLEALQAKHFPAAVQKKPRAGDPALFASFDVPGQEALRAVRVALASEARAKDGAFQLQLLKYLSAHQGGIDAEAWAQVVNAAVAAGQGRQAWALLAKTASTAPAGSPMDELVRQQAQSAFKSLVPRAETAFDGLKKELVSRQVRPTDWQLRDRYNLLQMRELSAAIDHAAAAAQAKGPLSAAQQAFVNEVREVLPQIILAARAAGERAGDTPGERAASSVNQTLYKGYQLFPGQSFLKALRAADLAPKGTAVDIDSGYFPTYTPEQLKQVSRFLDGVLKSGMGWDSDDKPRKLEAKELEYLQQAKRDVERAIKDYPKAAQLHGLAAAGLLALAPVLSPLAILLGLAVLGAAAWAALRFFGRSAPAPAPEARAQAPSSAVLERYKRVELSAKKLASSVTGGTFRSRFIGAGGTEFAEAKPYQGEDLREIDWKTSAKKDELYAKKFEQDKDVPLVLLIDLSASSKFGTQGADKKTVIEEAASVLALAAAHHNVRVGAIFFTDTVEGFIPPQGGQRHAWEIVRRLMTFEPKGMRTDLRPAMSLALNRLTSRAMVAVVSDFMAPDFAPGLAALSKRHDLRVLQVSDPSESRPLQDVGLLRVRDAETGEERDIDTSDAAFRAAQAAAVAQREALLSEAFRAARARPIPLSTDEDYLEELRSRFQPKKDKGA